MEVLLDTNFIAAAISSKAHVREQLEESRTVSFLVLSGVLEEIDRLPQKDKKAARTFLQREQIQLLSSRGGVDDQLVQHALERKAAVATLDGGLKKRLKKLGIQGITLSKNKIVFF